MSFVINTVAEFRNIYISGNVLFLESLLTGRVVQPRSTAAVDETIEVVGSNPAGGMGKKKSAMTMAKMP